MAYERHKFEDGQVLGAQQLNEMDEELARQKSWNELVDRPFYSEMEAETEVIHHLDPKYIKDMYYEVVEETTGPLNISWDGNVGDREYYVLMQQDGMEMGGCKISDVVLTVEDLGGGTITMTAPDGDQKMTIGTDGVLAVELTGVIGVAGAGILMGTEPLVVSFPEDCVAFGVQVTKGTYFVLMTMPGATRYTSNLANPNATITECKEEIHKIDNKYIDAEWMATEGEVAVDIVPKTTKYLAEDGGFIGAQMPELLNAGITVGEKYYVEFNGTEYPCVCKAFNFGKWMMGNGSLFMGMGDNTGEPFLIICADGCTLVSTQTGEAEIRVYTKGIGPMTIPEKFFPNDVARKKDLGFETYNLLELGLPRIPKDGSTVSVTTDKAAELRSKLETRPVWIGFGLGDSASDDGLKRILGIGYLDTGSSAVFVRAPLESHSVSFEVVEFEVFDNRVEAQYIELFRQEQTYLYLKSSTGGKLFKITVDDGGTLRATEVTA